MTSWITRLLLAGLAFAAQAQPIAKAHQFNTFTTPPNLQKAIAFGLGKGEAYYAGLANDQQASRSISLAASGRITATLFQCVVQI